MKVTVRRKLYKRGNKKVAFVVILKDGKRVAYRKWSRTFNNKVAFRKYKRDNTLKEGVQIRALSDRTAPDGKILPLEKQTQTASVRRAKQLPQIVKKGGRFQVVASIRLGDVRGRKIRRRVYASTMTQTYPVNSQKLEQLTRQARNDLALRVSEQAGFGYDVEEGRDIIKRAKADVKVEFRVVRFQK